MTNARHHALLILTEVLRKHRSLSEVLSQQLPQLAESEHPLCKQLCFGVMREYFLIQHLLTPLLKKPLRAKDIDISVILYLGAYQLLWLETANHAAIHETVNLTKVIRKQWASKLVNAILRQLQRQTNKVPQEITLTHPDWLRTRIQQDWPNDWQQILRQNQAHPPMTLRAHPVNRENYIALLASQHIVAKSLATCPSAIVLEKPVPVHRLPEFDQGTVSVQDAAAQQVAVLMDLTPRLRVLDACAAPGGKTSHMLQIEPSLAMVALDNKRLEKIQQTLQRQSQTAVLIQGDAQTTDWWDGKYFDRILCDVPCSATGIIRRHPDIKVLRSNEEIQILQHTQANILRNCWQLLKPGGYLLYSTCSILASENDKQIAHFLTTVNDATVITLSTIPGRITTYGVQSLPGEETQDGFYYAKLQKTQ